MPDEQRKTGRRRIVLCSSIRDIRNEAVLVDVTVTAGMVFITTR